MSCMTPTVTVNRQRQRQRQNALNLTCVILIKQGVQGYQMSHSKQSTGQLFVGQQDENRPDLILELVYLLDALP